MRNASVLAVILVLVTAVASAGETPSPEGARVYFITPQDGETLTSPVIVRFGLSGMGVAPAGVEKDKTGHHHLIVDAELPSMDEAVPSDENHRHFGGGQTEFSIELTPGSHSLQLLLGDWSHIPHNAPVVSERITIQVQ
jgi:hypothetical protein